MKKIEKLKEVKEIMEQVQEDLTDPVWTCIPCNREFDSEHGLNIHKAKVHGETKKVDTSKRYKCDHHDCDASFDKKTSLDAHKKWHTRWRNQAKEEKPEEKADPESVEKLLEKEFGIESETKPGEENNISSGEKQKTREKANKSKETGKINQEVNQGFKDLIETRVFPFIRGRKLIHFTWDIANDETSFKFEEEGEIESE